jgi:hypothetical protein
LKNNNKKTNLVKYNYMDAETESLPCADKLAFDTSAEARAAANVAAYRYGTKLHVYHCQHCGLWHLSSQPA